jgi:hypothetical protein
MWNNKSLRQNHLPFDFLSHLPGTKWDKNRDFGTWDSKPKPKNPKPKTKTQAYDR